MCAMISIGFFLGVREQDPDPLAPQRRPVGRTIAVEHDRHVASEPPVQGGDRDCETLALVGGQLGTPSTVDQGLPLGRSRVAARPNQDACAGRAGAGGVERTGGSRFVKVRPEEVRS